MVQRCMKQYRILFTDAAEKDKKKLVKSGDKQALKKIDKLITELRKHPRTGEGKPEPLIHYNGDVWSREITLKHRLVYEIFDDTIVVEVFQAWGHYDDR